MAHLGLAPGVIFTGQLSIQRPFDQNQTSSIVADGGANGNEYTLDGAVSITPVRRLVGFVPPADAVQEFKVETASFDAQQGHTTGANINVVLKSGTNDFHGTAYYFGRNDALAANDFFLNRQNLPRSALRYHLYGGTIGGPVVLPRFGEGGPALWSGRDKTFFFFSYEGIKNVFPQVLALTVPTLAQRGGDFSALLAQGITIYDPLTARVSGSRVSRQPIQCGGRVNVICPERINPIARNVLQFYPLPNATGDVQGRNNYITPNPRTDTYHNENFRLDHSLTEKQKFFVRYSHNRRLENRNIRFGVIQGVRPTGDFLERKNDNAVYDHVYAMTARTILNFRVGYSRFKEDGGPISTGEFNPASLGFSPATTALFGDSSYFPAFSVGPYQSLGGDAPLFTAQHTYFFQPTLTHIRGAHSLRFGYDFRAYQENASTPGQAAGQYTFGTNFTRGPLDNSPGAPIGQELASFLLGLPTGGLIDRNASRSIQTPYHAVWVQDDWKATKKLTLNLGLRYDYEGATTERFDRNTRGFNTASSNPVEAAARAAYAAAYAANPNIAPVTPENFRVRGGLLFTGGNDRGFWEPDTNNFQPRIGGAYQLNDKTVLRAGWGVFTNPAIFDFIQQAGFSQATNIVPTLDNGLTFVANLSNPFPNGAAVPPGSSLGLATFVGREVSFLPLARKNNQLQRWLFSVQRELPGRWLVEASYVGARGYDVTTDDNIDLNPVPRQYLSTSPVRDTNVINFLTALVPNPFAGLAPGTNLNAATVQRQQLLRPFPQFTRVRTRMFDGKSWF